MINKRILGGRYEALAMEHAAASGASPVESNFRCRMGEIDLIFTDDGYLVFAEVKYRSGNTFGSAFEAVSKSKMRTICKVTDFYRLTHKLPDDLPVRYDVFALETGEDQAVKISWIKNAFEHIY